MTEDEIHTRLSEISSEILAEKNARTSHNIAIAKHNERIGELQEEQRELNAKLTMVLSNEPKQGT